MFKNGSSPRLWGARNDSHACVGVRHHKPLKDKAGEDKEWNFPAVGEGYIDFGAVLRILEEEDYANPFSVEIEFQGEPWPPLKEVHRAMRASYETLKSLGLS